MHYLIIIIIIILVLLYLINMSNSKNPNIFLRALNKEELEIIFRNKKAKYLSTNDINRHYIITYNNDNTVTTDTYENNIKLGESYGTYNININGSINIKYKYVFSSPNDKSPFHPNNSFYKQLSNYTIGPYYIYSNINIKKNIIDGNILHIMYKGNQLETLKILTFYPK
jgi:hypothetical protein